MSLLSLCDDLRRRPLEFLSAECALSLRGFLVGYGYANGAIKDPLLRAGAHFQGSDEMSACTLAYLSSPDPRASFHRALDALEQELRISEPASSDVRLCPALLDVILESIETRRTGLFLMEPTSECLFETLNGYWCGMASFDPDGAQKQRGIMQRFEVWLRVRFAPAQAPWHAILRVYGGPLSVLEAFHRHYKTFLESESDPSRL